MRPEIEKIQTALDPIRKQIVNHEAYKAIHDLEDLKLFMEHHIYAVWDFMSLLKSLQNLLTCTQVPWVPQGNPQARYLINEIVCGEESDIAYGKPGHLSHFELYVEAMEQIGASTVGIEQVLAALGRGVHIQDVLQMEVIPVHARDFLNFTFEVIATQKPHVIASVFTFGREDLIPKMFHTIVQDMHTQFPEQVDVFKYYLDRHIEVDGDHHGHLAMEIITELCGDDQKKWNEVETYAVQSLELRNHLWNGVLESITEKMNI